MPKFGIHADRVESPQLVLTQWIMVKIPRISLPAKKQLVSLFHSVLACRCFEDGVLFISDVLFLSCSPGAMDRCDPRLKRGDGQTEEGFPRRPAGGCL